MSSGSMFAGHRVAIAALAASLLCGCDGLLDVSDPNTITADELDGNLPLVANGVEGAVHDVVDDWVIRQALLADVYQSTGTLEGIREIDLGQDDAAAHGMSGIANALIRALWFAGDAEARFKRVLGETATESSPLTAQVRFAEALADLYIGMTFCRWSSMPGSEVVSDTEMLAQAEAGFADALATARRAGSTDYAIAAQAGRAQARMLLDDWSGAEADAAAIPEGFSYEAGFDDTNANSVVEQTSIAHQKYAGLMYKWWPLIERSSGPGLMQDPWSGEPDPRIPVFFTGEPGEDGETPYRSQWKYSGLNDDIPILHSDLMQLIVAESRARAGDHEAAMTVLNRLRLTVGLTELDTPPDSDTMEEILLQERFAELFMEGQRLVDLHRKGLMREVFDALDDPERPGEGRPSKWGECGPG